MKKSTREIQSIKNKVDLFIEILDARAIKISRNHELFEEFKAKTISVAWKSDLAPKNIAAENILFANKFEHEIKLKLLQFINARLSNKKKYYQKKGLVNPSFNIMVVGLPNIGKSTFIKKLISAKNKISTANQPGVTKKITRYRLNKNFFIYDTPGIWLKKARDFQESSKLALINTIKHQILHLDDLVEYAYRYWRLFDKEQIQNFFIPLTLTNNFEKFLHEYCKLKRFWSRNNLPDIDRCLQYLFKLFINGDIGVINYDLIDLVK